MLNLALYQYQCGYKCVCTEATSHLSHAVLLYYLCKHSNKWQSRTGNAILHHRKWSYS